MINDTHEIAASRPRELNDDELEAVAGAGLRNLDAGQILDKAQEGQSGGGGIAGFVCGGAAEFLRELML